MPPENKNAYAKLKIIASTFFNELMSSAIPSFLNFYILIGLITNSFSSEQDPKSIGEKSSLTALIINVLLTFYTLLCTVYCHSALNESYQLSSETDQTNPGNNDNDQDLFNENRNDNEFFRSENSLTKKMALLPIIFGDWFQHASETVAIPLFFCAISFLKDWSILERVFFVAGMQLFGFVVNAGEATTCWNNIQRINQNNFSVSTPLLESSSTNEPFIKANWKTNLAFFKDIFNVDLAFGLYFFSCNLLDQEASSFSPWSFFIPSIFFVFGYAISHFLLNLANQVQSQNPNLVLPKILKHLLNNRLLKGFIQVADLIVHLAKPFATTGLLINIFFSGNLRQIFAGLSVFVGYLGIIDAKTCWNNIETIRNSNTIFNIQDNVSVVSSGASLNSSLRLSKILNKTTNPNSTDDDDSQHHDCCSCNIS